MFLILIKLKLRNHQMLQYWNPIMYSLGINSGQPFQSKVKIYGILTGKMQKKTLKEVFTQAMRKRWN